MNPLDGMRKVEAAHEAGCLRFDGAIRGVGGCPMAQDDLVGNAPTERLVEWAEQKGLWKAKSSHALDQAQSLAADLFG
jgi:hydroxymethylglutaryl-CoA lyase